MCARCGDPAALVPLPSPLFIYFSPFAFGLLLHSSRDPLTMQRGFVSRMEVVKAEFAGKRLYRYSQLTFANDLPSKSHCRRAILAGELRVNGAVAEDTRILKGEVIYVNGREEEREEEREKVRKVQVLLLTRSERLNQRGTRFVWIIARERPGWLR